MFDSCSRLAKENPHLCSVKINVMYTLNANGRLLWLHPPAIMGIINITPDSFYAESREQNIVGVLAKAGKMIGEGAVILDIGGQSTRPGADRVGVEEELNRVIPVIEALAKAYPETLLSVDTFYAKVAFAAVRAGASIVNDVSAGLVDSAMIETVAALKVPYIIMHIKGDPQTMQKNPFYQDVIREVLDFFIERIACCRKAGITDLIADPGIGFGKTASHNFTLIRQLDAFAMLQVPLMLGVSRKSIVYKTLGIEAEEALNGTTVLHTAGLLKGANLLRVHDVLEAKQAVDLLLAMDALPHGESF